MGIVWHTKKINIQNYYKIIRRIIIFNSSYADWLQFKKDWTVHMIPATQENMDKYSQFFKHLIVIPSSGIAWGITGKNIMYMFIVDSRNPFTIRSNAMPLGHELLHALYQFTVGTFHIRRTMDIWIGGTLKKKGESAPASTVIVHENWYGTKKTMKFWIGWGLGWLPITIPYIPLKQAKEIYNV